MRAAPLARFHRDGRAWRGTCAALVAVALALGGTAAARAADDASIHHADSESRIEVRASLYSWLTEQHGTVTQGGRTVKVDVGLDDVFDLLGNGDALGGAGYLDVYDRPTRLGGFMNGVGSVVDTSAKKNRADFGLDSSLAFVEWGLTYRLWQAWFDGLVATDTGAPRPMWLEAFVGGRYTYMGNTITVSASERPLERSISSNVDFVDPIVGGRWRAPLPYDFGLTFSGDIGGFDTGSKLSWSLASTVTYDLPWTLAGGALNLSAGYRIISFDYEDGSGDALRDIDLEFRGPLLGVLARF